MFLVALSSGMAQDRDLARVYADEAIELYRAGERQRAADVARRGLEFRSDESDLHVVVGRVAEHDSVRIRDAVAAYRRALGADRFVRFDGTETRARAAALLNRMGEHRQAIEIIEQAGIDPLFDRNLLFEYARALFGSGRAIEAEQRAGAGVRIYLDDPRFFRLLLERVPVPGFRDYLAVRRYEAPTPEYRRLLLSYLIRVPDSTHRREALERYFVLEGDDPVAALLLLESAGLSEAAMEREFDRFLALGGAYEHDLIRRAFEAGNDGMRERLLERFTDFTGELVVDRARKGVPEQRLIVSAGRLHTWEVDPNRDGRPEFMMSIENLLPRMVEHTGPGGYSNLEYGDYPAVRRVTFPDADGGRVVYRMIGDRLELLLVNPRLSDPQRDADGVVLPDALQPLALADPFTILDRDTVRRNAAFVEHHTASAALPHRIVQLENGQPVRSVADTTGDGMTDFVVRYENGLPAEGMRDLTGDGSFEVIETFRDGTLVMITVVSLPDRVAEYYEVFGALETRAWDLDRDGVIDVRERYLQDLLVQRQYTSGENGEFDLSIEFFSDILSIGTE
ncbi:MAG: hypothetical protein EA403_05190 [Spirochaetaceae bacterium]|nr:MAG: hypothetical protein EA403_05190 [Spirochaetaceae bacterium]